MTDASREIAWNIQHIWMMYVLFAVALGVSGYGIYIRVRRWKTGQACGRFDQPGKRIGRLIRHALLQNRLGRQAYVGLFHRMIFLSFMVLTLATLVVLLEFDFGIQLMKGKAYLYFQSLLVDVCGGLALVGIFMAMLRRWVQRPVHQVRSVEAGLLLILLFIILSTGFLLEGLRIAATQDPWAAWSPLGNLAARTSAAMLSADAVGGAHRILWWGHLLLVFGLLAWAPWTKMIHVLIAPFNIYTANLLPVGGNLKSMVFEDAETLGVKELRGFTWKDLADLDACTECGRCDENCPAQSVGKLLSPRDMILALRAQLHSGGKEVLNEATLMERSPFLSPEALWQCTTCGACVDACPVFVEQFPKIIDMRRYLVMEEANLPASIQEAVVSLESRGHPFRGTQATRVDWIRGLEVPLIADKKETDILLWVGSTSALLDRNQKAARALAELLIAAGVDFAILGREEKSTGDLARRVGNEFLFETLATENIETLARYRFNAIVTPCPHTYNTLKNEYPRLGGNYTVHHHSEYLAWLIDQGLLKVKRKLSGQITYHDPCYLGRHNNIFTPPRDLLRKCTGHSPIEMERCGAESFCCGGGGGMNFMEEPVDKRINRVRAAQALDTGADVVAVACPTCMGMLEDGINAQRGEKEVRIMDVAELLREAVCGDG